VVIRSPFRLSFFAIASAMPSPSEGGDQAKKNHIRSLPTHALYARRFGLDDD
jgi:hypothetical protein